MSVDHENESDLERKSRWTLFIKMADFSNKQEFMVKDLKEELIELYIDILFFFW